MISKSRTRPWKDENTIAPQPQCPLLAKLPRELRDQIWKLFISADKEIIIKAPGKEFCLCRPSRHKTDSQHNCQAAMPLPAILNCCQQIRREATLLYYKFNTFRCRIHDRSTMTPILWIESLSDEERSAVSKVIIELTVSEHTAQMYNEANEPNLSDSSDPNIRLSMVMPSGFLCDQFWVRVASIMSWRLDGFDQRKIEYQVDERLPYKDWMLEWKMWKDFLQLTT